MGFLEWLASSAGDLTASTILVAVIFAVVFGVQEPSPRYDSDGRKIPDRWGRPWWVPGWTYRQCVDDRIAQKAEIDAYIDGLKRRVEELEDAQQTRRRTRS